MAEVRAYRPEDLPALYDICLRTGDDGGDASGLYRDPRLLGEIYAAPYAALEPALAFVAEDTDGVAGYIVGTADTRAFEARCEARWWPPLRARYPNPPRSPDAWTWDDRRARQLHRPFVIPQAVVDVAPAHLHINLLPRMQGHGMGRRLLDVWLEAARGRAHLGCSARNVSALGFYHAYGFRRLPDAGEGVVWMAIG